MYKRICILYTGTTGLHQTNDDITKKNLFCFARMVTLNYEIGYFKNGEFIQEKLIHQIAKPRCMIIPEETIEFHGVNQKKANKKGIDPEELIKTFKDDLKTVDIIVSHNIDFHLKTVIAEALKYNIQIDFNNYIIIDTISFYHKYGFIKLKDLAKKLSIKEVIEEETDTINCKTLALGQVDLIKKVFLKLYSNYEKSIA